MTEKNPLIDNYNYWFPYQQNIEKLKASHPETLEFSKLCFETFQTEPGKKLMERLVSNYIIPPLVRVGANDYPTLCVYVAGFKEALLMLKNGKDQHLKYINDNKAKEVKV